MCEGTDSRCTTTATVRRPRLWAGGPSRFLCLSFFAAAKKVSAAPHRGNANRPQPHQKKRKEQNATPSGAKKANPLPLCQMALAPFPPFLDGHTRGPNPELVEAIRTRLHAPPDTH